MAIVRDKGLKSKTEEFKIKDDKEAIIERPRICCIDLSADIINTLKKTNANINIGTLGAKIKVPNNSTRSKHQILLNYNFPKNLHEYDIVIIDLGNFETKEYKPEEYIRASHTGKSLISLLCSYPETLFDPRPMSSSILRDVFDQITNRKLVVLAFSSQSYEVEYQPIKITGDGYAEMPEIVEHDIYSFWNVPTSTIKYGKELITQDVTKDFKTLLEKYREGSVYNQTFYHPKRFTNEGNVNDESYLPLFKNMSGEIVSYLQITETVDLMLFPQLKDKGNFLQDFLTKIAPSFYPSLFPFSTTFNWKKEKDYWLPRYSELLKEKENIKIEFENKNEEVEKKIQENMDSFSFLHEIISETGDKLTDALVKYLNWLEFIKVEKHDEKNENGILEEDIQVEFDNGLLIIECKGIGGTSSDADCSQISKIKHRRCRERGKFDVHAIYIVNHQRYLPPLKRQNPPFTDHQKQDAINDERGLLTTWQLFNLYFEIKNGIISKEEARKLILNHGQIEFRPIGINFIDEPVEIFNDGEVCIINLENLELKVHDEILIEKNGKFEKAVILDIQKDNKSIPSASKGELGLKLNKKIGKKCKLWNKVDSE
jgi:hypothetical protein